MLDLFWGDRTLDLNFVAHTDRIGQFDIETLVWRWPERDFVDRHGARAALRRGTIRLVRNVDGEDPLLLLVRLLKLSAKYGLRITDPAHGETVDALHDALARWRPADEAHGRIVEERQAAIMRRGCARAADPAAFLSEVHASGLLRHTAPWLHASLERLTVQGIADER